MIVLFNEIDCTSAYRDEAAYIWVSPDPIKPGPTLRVVDFVVLFNGNTLSPLPRMGSIKCCT